ncbi:MAG: helix-turn-helix transcriptional regulator, partial [Halobacteriales archaeon]|nr:helix-turn-helix transcriptional regulator [Halobacteriales archaeon]
FHDKAPSQLELIQGDAIFREYNATPLLRRKGMKVKVRPASRVVVTSHPRTDLCPVTETIKIIGKKWYLILLHELTSGPRGFNDLRRSVRGISAKVLSESLRHLEQKGLVERKVHSESPIRVEYTLTQKGRELESLFDGMKAWGDKWHVCEDADNEVNARLVPEPTVHGRL